MTDTIRHHLSNKILMAYSAGTLPEAFNLMVATHISVCDDCRAQAETFDMLGGAVLDKQQAGTASVLAPDCLEQTLALIAGGPVPDAHPVRGADPVLPGPLQDYIGGGLHDVNWRPVGMGVKQAILETSPDATARLLHIPAGTAMPSHGHNGVEMTMVLQGAFSDEHNRFARGDVEIADEDMHHTPIAHIDEDCICLAVSDAPLRFKNL
ncbi:MAG: cupin domain-containing protein, partial [Rhodobacteraceae bacterium]|nr:cupin domain-containing protein [Paracoccaceae bacterium]